MKMLSRKSLVAVATAAALSTTAFTAPAFAEDSSLSSGSSVPSLSSSKTAEGEIAECSDYGSSTGNCTYIDGDKTKTISQMEYTAKKLGAFVKMLTTIASLFTAIFSISKAIEKLAPKA